MHIFVPLDDRRVEIAPKLQPLAHEVRGWVRGQGALENQDRRAYWQEIPEGEWFAFYQMNLRVLLDRVQDLLDAATADDAEAMARFIEDINDELERHRAALERRRERQP